MTREQILKLISLSSCRFDSAQGSFASSFSELSISRDAQIDLVGQDNKRKANRHNPCDRASSRNRPLKGEKIRPWARASSN